MFYSYCTLSGRPGTLLIKEFLQFYIKGCAGGLQGQVSEFFSWEKLKQINNIIAIVRSRFWPQTARAGTDSEKCTALKAWIQREVYPRIIN